MGRERFSLCSTPSLLPREPRPGTHSDSGLACKNKTVKRLQKMLLPKKNPEQGNKAAPQTHFPLPFLFHLHSTPKNNDVISLDWNIFVAISEEPSKHLEDTKDVSLTVFHGPLIPELQSKVTIFREAAFCANSTQTLISVRVLGEDLSVSSLSSLMGTSGQQQLAGNSDLATSAGKIPRGQQAEAVLRLLWDISPWDAVTGGFGCCSLVGCTLS